MSPRCRTIPGNSRALTGAQKPCKCVITKNLSPKVSRHHQLRKSTQKGSNPCLTAIRLISESRSASPLPFPESFDPPPARTTNDSLYTRFLPRDSARSTG